MESMNSSEQRSFRDIHGRKTPPPLWTLLPQSVPYGMLIEPTNLCNFKCPFCPTGNEETLKSVGRPRGMMKFDLYEKIIHDLEELTRRSNRKVHHLQFWKDGEPLLHPKLPEMIRLARRANVANSIEVTTNASYWKNVAMADFVDAAPDLVRISVEHVNENAYRSMTNKKHGYSEIRENVRALYQTKQASGQTTHIHAKIIDTGLSSAEKAQFIEDFAPISDSWNIECMSGWSLTQIQDFTLGAKSGTASDGITPRKKRLVCPEPFAKLAINFNGLVSICCVDWSHGTIVGDTSRETISEIWNGQKLSSFRNMHLSGQRHKISACADCDFIEHFPAFADLDEHREKLLEIFNGTPVAG